MRNLVERLLPLGTYYTGISAFIEHRSHLDYGLVNHALCAAIRDMLKVRGVSFQFYFLLPVSFVIGLSNPSVATRTLVQHLPAILASEALVLRSSHCSHPFHNLSTHPRTRHSRWSLCRSFLVFKQPKYLRRRGRSPKRGTWYRNRKTQISIIWERPWNIQCRNTRQGRRGLIDNIRTNAEYVGWSDSEYGVCYTFTGSWDTLREYAQGMGDDREARGSVWGVDGERE